MPDEAVQQLSRTFKALSDPTRLEIVALLLRHGELCVCDAEAILGVTQSKASRHLRYLHAAGIVEDRRDGLWVHYRLAERGRAAEQRRLLRAVGRLLPDARVAGLEARYHAWMAAKQEAPGVSCRAAPRRA
ncbi:MAG: metalloregulator ArsR/SmtB family transcription factor [Gemmatimonadota bacterium]|nr:metalloregulator ArsR/SmtB family transcription factor [Gemmatimonadota bacterium]